MGGEGKGAALEKRRPGRLDRSTAGRTLQNHPRQHVRRLLHTTRLHSLQYGGKGMSDERALNEREYDFLKRVCCGQDLRLADREEDRARQKVRRMNLVEVLPNPR